MPGKSPNRTCDFVAISVVRFRRLPGTLFLYRKVENMRRATISIQGQNLRLNDIDTSTFLKDRSSQLPPDNILYRGQIQL